MPANRNNNFLYRFLIEPEFRLGRHILFSLVFILISAGQSLFVFGEYFETSPGMVFGFVAGNAAFIILFAYFNLYVLVPRLLQKDKYAEYFIVLIVSCIFYLLIKTTTEHYLLRNIGVERNYNIVTFLDGLSNLVLYSICIASSSVSALLRQWVADTEKIDHLENKQLKSSVDKIKNQINPRSLSTILNYASDRVKADPEEVSDILFRLSDVLRYELYDCKREKVLLESDIQFLDKYLSLEQLKSEQSFTYTISVAGKSSLFVAPMIFVPIVQQVLEQHPAHIIIEFNIDKQITFRCKAPGTDLTQCGFAAEAPVSLYQRGIGITENKDSVELHLEICSKK